MTNRYKHSLFMEPPKPKKLTSDQVETARETLTTVNKIKKVLDDEQKEREQLIQEAGEYILNAVETGQELDMEKLDNLLSPEGTKLNKYESAIFARINEQLDKTGNNLKEFTEEVIKHAFDLDNQALIIKLLETYYDLDSLTFIHIKELDKKTEGAASRLLRFTTQLYSILLDANEALKDNKIHRRKDGKEWTKDKYGCVDITDAAQFFIEEQARKNELFKLTRLPKDEYFSEPDKEYPWHSVVTKNGKLHHIALFNEIFSPADCYRILCNLNELTDGELSIFLGYGNRITHYGSAFNSSIAKAGGKHAKPTKKEERGEIVDAQIIDKFSFVSSNITALKVEEKMLFFALMSSGEKEAYISYDDLAQLRGQVNNKKFKQKIKKSVQVLQDVKFTNEADDLSSQAVNLLQEHSVSPKLKGVKVVFTDRVIKAARQHAAAYSMPRELYSIDTTNYPAAFEIGLKLFTNTQQNFKNKNQSNKISVVKLLQAAPTIPRAEDYKFNSKIRQYVITPLQRALDHLVNIGFLNSWEFVAAGDNTTPFEWLEAMLDSSGEYTEPLPWEFAQNAYISYEPAEIWVTSNRIDYKAKKSIEAAAAKKEKERKQKNYARKVEKNKAKIQAKAELANKEISLDEWLQD